MCFSTAERNCSTKKENNNNGKLCNVMLEVQTGKWNKSLFSSIFPLIIKILESSCNKACALEEGGNCCKCYNVIFQSRPRIVRTPP